MKVKKGFIVFIVFILLFAGYPVFADDECEVVSYDEMEEALEASKDVEFDLKLNSRAAVIYDRSSKEVIFGKDEKQKRPMASTTKIMSSILTIENGHLDDVIKISKKAAGVGGSRLKVKTDDSISVNDLLYGLMLVSGNDCAVQLAEYVGGSEQGFADMMNAKADELGLSDTHFVTPHGLDKEGHYTSAYDLAKLTDYALNNKKFAEIVSTKNYTISINGYSRNLSNTNELLGYFEGVNGVKTGFTNGAGRCLVTSAKRDNMNIITVVLGADTKKFRTVDSMKLIEYAYENYKVMNIKNIITDEFENWKNINEAKVYVNKGKSKNVKLKLGNVQNEFVIIRKKDEEDVEVEIDCLNYIFAPVKKDEVLGKLRVLVNREVKFSVDIVAYDDVEKMRFWGYYKFLIKNYNECFKINIK